MLKLGQKLKFDPWHGIHSVLGRVDTKDEVEGTIIYVHPNHHYVMVEYELGGEKFKTSFNYADIFGDDRTARLIRR